MPGPGKYEIQSQFKSGQSVDGAAQNDDDDDDDEDEDAQSRAPFGSRQQVWGGLSLALVLPQTRTLNTHSQHEHTYTCI